MHSFVLHLLTAIFIYHYIYLFIIYLSITKCT